MPATAGEPFRGCAKIIIPVATEGFTQGQRFTVYLDAGFPDNEGADNTLWEAAPGGSLTLRAKWTKNGVAQDPTRFDVQVRLPGGAQVGSTWNVPLELNVEKTRTFHFDSDPLSQVLDAIRAGTLELFIEVQSTTGIDPWGPFDSRGTQTDPPVTFNTANARWARGSVRARSMLSSYAVSNASLGGAEPASFAYPDTTFNRLSLAETLYRAEALTLEHRSGGTSFRSQAGASAASGDRDHTWAGNSGLTARVNNDYPSGSVGVRVILPTRDFGGDNETAWAASGHPSGFSRTDDRTLDHGSRIQSNPSLSFTRHLQADDNVFGLTKNISSGERLAASLGFVAARIQNARGEGVNLPGTASAGRIAYSLQDAGGLVTPTTDIGDTTTRDGQAGWGDLMAWDAQLPGGAWEMDVTVDDADGVQGSATLLYTLVAVDPSVLPICGAEPVSANDHLIPGEDFKVSMCLRRSSGEIPDGIMADAGVALIRFLDGVAQHFDGADWVDSGAGDVTIHPLTASPGDARVFERTFSTDDTWSRDLTLMFYAELNGVPYTATRHLPVLGSVNRHSASDFDPTGLFK